MWALAFTAMVPSHILAAQLGTRPAHVVFSWLLPIFLVVWAAKRTAAVSGSAERGEQARSPEP